MISTVEAVAPVEDEAASDDDECANDITHCRYESSEAFKLQSQRSFDACINLGGLVDLAILGGVADGGDFHDGAALDDGGAAHQGVGGVGGVAVGVGFEM